MAKKTTTSIHPDNARRRKEAGHYLRRLRETANRTQQEVAQLVGLEYYTMVSQVERGLARLPPDRLQSWAQAVGAEPREFVKRLLRYYDPYSWQIIFGTQSRSEDA